MKQFRNLLVFCSFIFILYSYPFLDYYFNRYSKARILLYEAIMHEEREFWETINANKEKLSIDRLIKLTKKQERYKYKFYKDCLETIRTKNNSLNCKFKFKFNFAYLKEQQEIILIYKFDKKTVEFHKSLSLGSYINDNNQRCKRWQSMGEYYMYNYIGNELYPNFDLSHSWGETHCEDLTK